VNFFATKPFNRMYGLEVKGLSSPDLVHKGEAVSIGGDWPFERLSEHQQRLVVELRWNGFVCDAEDFQKIELLKKEITQELKREKQARRQSQKAKAGQGASIFRGIISPLQAEAKRHS
jgi:hypothetical protein